MFDAHIPDNKITNKSGPFRVVKLQIRSFYLVCIGIYTKVCGNMAGSVNIDLFYLDIKNSKVYCFFPVILLANNIIVENVFSSLK